MKRKKKKNVKVYLVIVKLKLANDRIFNVKVEDFCYMIYRNV